MEGANKGNMLASKVVLSAEQQEGERADDVELRMLVMTRKMMENMYQRAEDRARATQRGTIRFFP